MKKILRNCLYISIGVVLFSCKTGEVKVYSCDKATNEWAKQNLGYIRTLTRDQWNNLDEDRKRAAYVAFNPEQRIALWKGKIEQILTLEWSEEELEHIQTFNQFIDSHHNFFRNKKLTKAQLNELEAFGTIWKEKAEKELGWSHNLILSITHSANNLLDKNGTIETVED